MAPEEGVKQVLVDHWRAYPVGGDVALDYEQGSMVTYQWRRKVRELGEGMIGRLEGARRTDRVK